MIEAVLLTVIVNGPPLKGVVHDAARSVTLIDQAKRMGYQPCAHEDSVGPCYWDATWRGNGLGVSFVVTDDNEIFFDYSL